MLITSRNNPFVRRVFSLREKKYRREYGEYFVEGVKQVREAFAGGAEVREVVAAESYSGEIFSEEKLTRVSDSVFEKLSDEPSPQGILAVLALPETEAAPPAGRSLLLDGIADPGNLGTILRTANAAGYEDIYLRACADPFAPRCVRAAMSGVFFVRLHTGTDAQLSAVLSGVPLICADMEGEDVFSFSAPEKFCLVIGNEGSGVTQEVRAACSYTVRIPMPESCESLTAAVSAGILMYELCRGRAFPPVG